MKGTKGYKGIVDPISGVFKLAEEVSGKAGEALFYSLFSILFTCFALFFILLLLISIAAKNSFLAMVLLAVFIMGILTLWLILYIRSFLNNFLYRYSAIKALRDGPPSNRIPMGKSMTERYLNYLRDSNQTFKRLLNRTPEVLHKDAYIKGKSGKRHRFDAYVLIKPSFLKRIIGKGYTGYALFIRELHNIPEDESVKRFLDSIYDVYRITKVIPSRAVLIFRSGQNYKGIPEILYNHIADEGFYLTDRKRFRINLQVVVELPDGVYEFLPFMPEMPNVLP